jgi:hypothetical protein
MIDTQWFSPVVIHMSAIVARIVWIGVWSVVPRFTSLCRNRNGRWVPIIRLPGRLGGTVSAIQKIHLRNLP